MSLSESGDALIGRFAADADQRTALQFAFYNTLLFTLLGICLCGLFAMYNMMYMFLAPMMWAFLVGTVLFPFKKKVTDVVKVWLSRLRENDQTLVLGVILLPFNTIVDTSEFVYTNLVSHNGVIIGISYLLLKVLSYGRTFVYMISWFGKVYNWLDSFILCFTRAWVLPLIIIYFLAYATWIYVQEKGAINKKLARALSLPIWVYVLSNISLYFGPLRAGVFGASGLVLALLSAGTVAVDDASGSNSKLCEQNDDETQQATDETNSLSEKNPPPKVADVTDSSEVDTLDDAISGDRLIRLIFGLCSLLWVVRHDSALVLIAALFVIAVIRRVADAVGFCGKISTVGESLWEHMAPNVKKIVDVTVAGPLRQFVKVLFTSDQMLVSGLYARMDVFSSLIVMLLLALSTMSGFIFCGMQIHGETAHLIRLTSNVVSSRPDWMSAVMNYTEDQLDENQIDIDQYAQQAYEQGRAWLATNARNLADSKDPKRADMLEEQVKHLKTRWSMNDYFKIVDNLYRLWEERNNVVDQGSTSAVSRGDIWTQLRSVTDLHALKDEITLIVHENLDTLMQVAQQLWAIIAVNLSFISSILAAFAGVILGFGMDIVNLLIELIVFLTMVYYLLSASHDRWLPLEWASRLTNVASTSTNACGDVTAAVEHAIFGVFVLSAKMSVFYGLYTYFVHSLFDLNVVFVPSMLAALFAAIPIMAPYFVCVFGVFELWLVRGETAAALVFALFSIAPVAFADATFYREIKGSHPYVTGLAIIGGMYWLGLQGAIIGPIVLCTSLVLINVYMQFSSQQLNDTKKND